MGEHSCFKNILKFNTKLNEFLEKEEHCDVVIEVHGTCYPCHKVALCTASKFFDDLFKNTNNDHIQLDNVDVRTMEVVLQFAYTGKIEITKENVHEIDRINHTFKLVGVKELCYDCFEEITLPFVQEKFTLAGMGLFETFSHFSHKKDGSLISILSRCIMQNFDQIWPDDDKLLNLFPKDMNILISQHWYLNPRNWESFKTAVNAWVDHKSESRATHGEELRKQIELQNIFSTNYTNDVSIAGSSSGSIIVKKPLPCLHIYLDSDENEHEKTRVYSAEKQNPTWMESCIIPEAYINVSCVEFGGDLYCLSTSSTHSTFCAYSSIDISEDQIKRRLSCPPRRIGGLSLPSLCRIQNNIYLSNCCATDIIPVSSNFKPKEILQGIYRYNIDLDTWNPLPLYNPGIRNYEQRLAVVNDDVLYVVKSGSGHVHGIAKVSVLALDTRLSKWQELKSLKHEGSIWDNKSVVCCAHNGKIYVSYDQYCSSTEFPVFRYDVVANKWQKIKPIKEYKAQTYNLRKLLSYGSYVWAFGEDDEGYQNVKIYNPLIERWGPSPISTGMDSPEENEVVGFFLDAIPFY